MLILIGITVAVNVKTIVVLEKLNLLLREILQSLNYSMRLAGLKYRNSAGKEAV